MTDLALRRYQQEAIDAVRAEWAHGNTRTAVVLPTGMGKTVIFAHLAKQALFNGRGKPMVLVHRDELAQQAVAKLRAIIPGVDVGVIKAERDDTDADVLVASVQTLAREKRRARLPTVGTVVVDECHHAAADSYVRILRHVGVFDNQVPMVGFTATLARNDERKLKAIFQSVAYERDIMFGIKAGFLADAKGRAVEVDGLNLAQVARTAGDYKESSLAKALLRIGAGQVLAQAYREHAADRSGVLFAPDVESTHVFVDDLNQAGVVAEPITGATPAEERNLALKRHEHGDTQVLVNCMVLTEGWDAPWTSCAVVARPTQSQSLYTQMVGRVLRPFPRKDHALVLDVVGASSTHKLTTMSDLFGQDIEPDETAAQAARRREQLEEDDESEVGAAPAVAPESHEVDLFHQSRSVWLQTPGGTWFIPTRGKTFVLWPSGGGHKVGSCSPYSKRDGKWLTSALPLEYAMAWAEQYAAEADPQVSNRQAPWRRDARPSQEQLKLARRYGVDGAEQMRKGELSDAISIRQVAKLFDR